MGFFSRDVKPKAIPMNKYQITGADYLKSLLGTTPNIPTAGVAGLSDAEQAGQSLLMKVMNGGGDFGTGMNYARGVMNENIDPANSMLYKGIKGEAAINDQSAINAIRRRGQLGWGGMGSGPNARAESTYRVGANSKLEQILGQMYEQERARKDTMNNVMLGADSSLINLASTYGALPRQIEQQKKDADYNALLQKIMFPYQTQANIAGQLVGAANPGNYLQSYPSGVDKWQTIGSLISTLGIMPYGGMGNQAGVSGIS